MNIYTQCCGIVLELFLLFLYKSRKTFKLTGEKNFLAVIFLTIISLSLDTLSVIALYNRAVLAKWVVEASTKAYLISLIWVGWMNFTYVTLDLNSDIAKHTKLVMRMTVVSAIETVITIILPVYICADYLTPFTYGPAVTLVYIFVLFYIFSTLAVSFYILSHKNSRRGLAVFIANMMWITAAAIQIFVPQLLIVGFSCAVGVMVLYIVMENPDARLDRQLGCFNSYALSEYVDACIKDNCSFGVFEINVTDIRALEESGVTFQNLTKEIISKTKKEGNLYLFKNISYSLVFVSRDCELLETYQRKISRLILRRTDPEGKILMFSVKDAQQFGSSVELLKFLTYIHSVEPSNKQSVLAVSDNMIANYRKVQRLEKEIAEALEEDRVEVFLQPICHQSDKSTISAEALARIRNRDGSMISPSEFIPVAEATGQIKLLGERVLEKVCEFLRDSEAAQLGLSTIDVNLSPIQCEDSSMAERLSNIVEVYGIDPESIIFEITETAVNSAKESLLANMNALVSQGFGFALDDFGKGESNLIYIVEMPAKVIKLDIDMSKAYFSNQKAQHVVKAIVSMAHQLDLSIVVEGIETQAEMDSISEEGIDYIQGYYYSRPLPMSNFIEYLKTR